MIRSIITFLLIFYMGVIGCSQVQFGIRAGTTYGQHHIQTSDVVLTEGYEGFGISLGVLADYSFGKHNLSTGFSAYNVHAIFNTAARFGWPDESTNFYFVDIPIVYTYRVLDKIRLGGGIVNAFLIEQGVKLANQLDGPRYPYYFGLIGEIEYDLIYNFSIAGSYKYLGLFQEEGEPYYFFPLYGLDIRYRF